MVIGTPLELPVERYRLTDAYWPLIDSTYDLQALEAMRLTNLPNLLNSLRM